MQPLNTNCFQCLQYGGKLLPPACKMNYVYRQHNYVHMGLIYVSIQHNYVHMQHSYVNMENEWLI